MKTLAASPRTPYYRINSSTKNISHYRTLVVAIVMALSCFYSGKIFAQDTVSITLKGDTGLLDTMKVEQGYSYTEPGYSANSSVYGDITKDVIVTSKMVGGTASFNNLVPGTYVFSYNVMDAAGNKATTRNRVVRITFDKTPPNLIVNNPDTVYFEVTKIPYGPLYRLYPHVISSKDLVDGNLTASVFVDTQWVQTTVVGIYPVIYTSSDISGNKATVYRYIDVIDTIKPVLVLNASNPDTTQLNVPYVDAGVNIIIPNGYLTKAQVSRFLKVNSTVDISVVGIYHVIYSLTDTFGNVAKPVTRTVVVSKGHTKPLTITLVGPIHDSVLVLNTYVDRGYTVSDNFYSSSSVKVTTSGTFVNQFKNNYANKLGGGRDSAVVGPDYTYTYTARDSAGNTARVTRYVEVYDNIPPNLKFSIDTTICKGSCPVLTPPVSGTTYLWSTGVITKSLQFCPTSDTSVKVVVNDSFLSTSRSYLYKITVTKTSCVWPGDANGDGVADKNDVLALGVAYGDTGVKRPNASLNWSGQPCNDWANSFKSGANYKNADCNGDGKVDSTDMAAVYKNYGYTHSKGNGSSGGPSDPPLSITFSKDSTLAGETVSATINLGSSSNPVSNAYGLAFSIPYNSFYVHGGKASVNLSNCWLGTAGKNLIYLLKDDSANSVIDFAVTRTDHKSMSGYGEIGTVSLVMQDNLGGKTWVNRKVVLTPSEVTLISSNETPIPIYAKSDSMIVTGPLAGISNQASNVLKDIMLYPNPASQNINIDPGNQTLTGIRVVNEIGKVVFEQLDPAKGRIQIPVSTLNSGMYTVIINSKNGTVARQVLKN